MKTSAILWIVTIVMAVLAVGVIALPLLGNKRRNTVIGLAVALPIFAAGMYWFLGTPGAADRTLETTRTAPGNLGTAATRNESVGSVASMVDGLAEKLKAQPTDSESWLLLARSYEHLGRTKEAIEAYERAALLGEYDAKLAALAGSPDAANSNTVQIFGNLQLSDSSRDIVQPTDTVFIFARAVQGPPMPVAVLQMSAADLPFDFLLNDAQAMTPEFKLSDFEKVVVTARISRSGIATEALQDLEASTDTLIVADNQHVSLTIE